jgi:1-acyl-sn-glycerol-3-phosphate acyltransferase
MFYWAIRFIAQVVFALTMRVRQRGLERTKLPEGCVLACSHVSHLDPVCLSVKLRRKIYWMARKEFYANRWSAGLMRAMEAFPVNRQGVPVSAIKTAIRRVREGKMVGIFPEGEVTTGAESVLRGGAIKLGVCLVAQRANCPVLPCVVLGSDKLSAVEPWLPALRGRLWILYGDPIRPTEGLPKREQRQRMAEELTAAFEALYAEAREHFRLPETILP